MSLSHLELSSILQEMTGLQGSLLREVYQPTRAELILSLRTHQGNEFLLLSIHPQFARLHRIDKRPPNPPKPHPFQMLCRKMLHGRLVALEQVAEDRVVRFEFQGDPRATLIAELTGRHGNLFILDENQRILGTLKPLRADKRNLHPGAPYVPPPRPTNPVRVRNRFVSRPPGMGYQEAVAEHYRREITHVAAESHRRQLLTALRREIKRLQRRQTALESDLTKAEQAEQFRRYGDVLQIHLADIPKGRRFVVLPDPFDDGNPLEIPLDPAQDALGNMQKYYRRYKKYDASIPFVLERLEEVEKRTRSLQSAMALLETATDMETLQAIEKRFHLARRPTPHQVAKPNTDKKTRRERFSRYVNAIGREIWVGRGARDNDWLTFRVARGKDTWLHVLGRPGAHVVIPCRPHPPDLDTLLDAATLALKHSGGQTGDTAEVCYTQVKHVRKPTGAPPGQVIYSQEKSLRVTLDSARLARLTRPDNPETTG